MVLYPDEGVARRENGYFCPANLPKPGERVDVLGDSTRTATVISSQQASQRSLYGEGSSKLKPVPGFESDCTVSVLYDDGSVGVVSAAELPQSRIEQLAPFIGYGGILALEAFLDGDYTTTWEDAKERHRELIDELKSSHKNSGASSPEPPPSGEWWGASEESDAGDQAVRSTIKFGRDGSVTGRGIDGTDGAYRIRSGRWGVTESSWGVVEASSRPKLVWKEVYDEGFEVLVEGHYDARAGKINARFTSSRGVSGTFALTPKPSIF